MDTMKRMRKSMLGIDINRAHIKTRNAAMCCPMLHSETCFSGYSKLTMKQLQEMSINRQNKKEA